MQIQINTDNHIKTSDNFNQDVASLLQDKLNRFGARITRLEVSFTDQNSAAKSGDDDKRCVIEARLNGLQPVAVNASADQVMTSLRNAISKLQSLLDTTLGKLDAR